MKIPTIALASVWGVPALMVALLLGVCGCNDGGEKDKASTLPTETEIVQMYNYYIERDYAKYVDQMESLDHKPESYRSQMVDLMKQLRHRQDSIHQGGPLSCRVLKIEAADGANYCDVFLEVTYHDRSFEQILVPMVRKDDVWRLK